MINHICGFCGKFFKTTYNRSKFCSKKCFHLSLIIRIKKKCLVCNKQFEVIRCRQNTAKFCSKKCETKSQNYKYNFRKATHTHKIGNKYAKGNKPNKTSFKKGQTAGEKNSNWKGGITSENEKIRKSKKCKEWKKRVFERDGYACVDCELKGTFIVAHHIKPFAIFPELRFDINNGISLCKKCHNSIHLVKNSKYHPRHIFKNKPILNKKQNMV